MYYLLARLSKHDQTELYESYLKKAQAQPEWKSDPMFSLCCCPFNKGRTTYRI